MHNKRVRLFLTTWLGALLCASLPQPARAANTEANLVLASETARPGDTVMAGIHLHMQPGWHTYWRYPGGSGMATTVTWHLPAGITAGEIQWPVPEKLLADEFTTYVYMDDVVLLVPLKIAANVAVGPKELNAQVSWLECKMSCVPGKADIQASLSIGSEAKPSTDATLIKTWQGKPPAIKPDLAARAWWEKPATGDARPLLFEWAGAAAGKETDFFPYGSDQYEVQFATESTQADPGKIRIRKIVKKLEGDWPNAIAGLLVQKTGNEPVAYEINLPISPNGDALAAAVKIPAPNSSATIASPNTSSLAAMLLYAFIGGLILNVMPCVLPVIALKILGFVNQAKQDRREVRKLGFVYGAGVLVSFLVLAALVIGVKSLGHAASWGMQFQNPQFLIAMTVLAVLVALNLFGIFEITLSGRLMGAAGDLASQEGNSGAFFKGVLATPMATPSTAPFLGAALGFAFTQPPVIIIAIFLTVGLGLAAPYIILSCQPAWLKFLPKPGMWMERFKIAMGFPMLATAFWLFTLAAPNFGEDGDFWLGLFLIVIAMIAWIWGQFIQRGRTRKALSLAVCLALLIFDYGYILEGQLHWRNPPSMARASPLKNSAEEIDWQPWSSEAVQTARAAGRPVLVDFTAKWCTTCQVNKKYSIEIPSVRAKLKEINAVALIENSFTKDAIVVAELNRYQRAGVPLVLVYPKEPDAPPQVLPELLTPGIVLDALDKAAQ